MQMNVAINSNITLPASMVPCYQVAPRRRDITAESPPKLALLSFCAEEMVVARVAPQATNFPAPLKLRIEQAYLRVHALDRGTNFWIDRAGSTNRAVP
jgi:hypothetical protein